MAGNVVSSDTWKLIFKTAPQRLITDCALLTYMLELRSLVDAGYIEEEQFALRLADAQALMGRDITQLPRHFRARLVRKDGAAERDLKGTMQSLFFDAKKQQGASEARLLEDKMRRMIDIEVTLNVLREARNVYAHDLGAKMSHAWNNMVISSALYFFEKAEVPKNMRKEVEAFVGDLRGYATEAQAIEPMTREKVEPSVAPDVDSIATELAEIRRLLDLKPTNASNESSTPISEVELEQSLLEIKQRISSEHDESPGFGPMANLCQKSIINEVIRYKPRDLKEMLRLPDIGWRVQKNPALFKAQINKHGSAIADLLSRTDWDQDDAAIF